MDVEIRDPAEARRFLAQGLWLQRAARPSAATVAPALRWSAELASGGDPLPPAGFVADAGTLALDGVRDPTPGRPFPEVPGWPAGLARAYEDLVLGRLDADGSMARASAALARYRGRDRSRGLAFLLDALRRRAGFPGALLNPAAIKAAQEMPADALLAEGWESLARGGPMPVLVDLYGRLVDAVREIPEALGPEDVFELESRTALLAFADRVAIRQVVRAAAEFEAGIAAERPRPSALRHDVASRVLDEDMYPVGGYSSISTRGSIESLLHSQLVYMDRGERPDLFDIKYARDELLYYARDENQFLRRRYAFQVVLDPSLALARVKDAALPYQRVVLVLAMLVAAVHRLTEWLGDESIVFEFLFLRDGDAEPLAAERSLLEMALRDGIANGTVVSDVVDEARLPERRAAIARGARCRGLVVTSAEGHHPEPCGFPTSVLRVGGDHPSLDRGPEAADPDATGEAPAPWNSVLDNLLMCWTTDRPAQAE
jgi:hypothetical protein